VTFQTLLRSVAKPLGHPTWYTQPLTRREALLRLGGGLGGVALSTLLADAGTHDVKLKKPHFAPKARGGHLAVHARWAVACGPARPEADADEVRRQASAGRGRRRREDHRHLLGSPFKFRKFGKSGLELAEILPHIAGTPTSSPSSAPCTPSIAIHEQALWMMHGGLIVAGRPSLGAWAAYGLGTANQNLPAYVVLPDPRGLPVDGIRNWSAGWLPPCTRARRSAPRGRRC